MHLIFAIFISIISGMELTENIRGNGKFLPILAMYLYHQVLEKQGVLRNSLVLLGDVFWHEIRVGSSRTYLVRLPQLR